MINKLTTIISILVLSILVFTNCNEPSEDAKNQSSTTTTKVQETSEITCPHCGHTKLETLPTEVCQIRYTCENCEKELTPLGEDCCVFCTYGTHKCPSMQK